MSDAGPNTKFASRAHLPVRLLIIALAAALLAPATASARSASGASADDCQVGQPTGWHTSRFGPAAPAGNPVKFFSPVLILACGPTPTSMRAGPLEIVGYETSEGLCTSGQVAESKIFGGFCFPAGTSWQEFASGPLYWENGGWSGGGGPTETDLAGYIDTDVASVEVRFHRDGMIWTKPATVAQVDGELLTSLGASEPFGRFATLLPGCVPPQEINVIARGPDGRVLGAQRGRYEGPYYCDPAAAIEAAAR